MHNHLLARPSTFLPKRRPTDKFLRQRRAVLAQFSAVLRSVGRQDYRTVTERCEFTIGIVEVASFATRAAGPPVAISDTRRCTTSAVKAGSRSLVAALSRAHQLSRIRHS